MRRLDSAAVESCEVGELIEPLRNAFRRGAVTPVRTQHELTAGASPATLLMMPAWRRGGPFGVKLVTVFPQNFSRGRPTVSGEYLLFDGDSGESLAVIDGAALTLLRTAAVSALAAELLAPAEAAVLLMVGTGALAPHLIKAHRAVRRYRQILVWGRDPAKATAVAARLAGLAPAVGVADDLARAVSSADVISCATLAEQPLVRGEWLGREVHVDLVGGFKPTMREADEECFRRASRVAVDTPDALEKCGDLIDPIASGALSRARVVTLDQLVAGPRHPPRAGVTVFKSAGYALADLATAEWLLARSAGGATLDPPGAAPARSARRNE
ncbi:MAG TPA: ornithine cyclodeaminase family protein [Steroidobacteraceae bacterium]|nr:ornithine cyclodeaminase family protein [Steroidobacteraceae bacterium]